MRADARAYTPARDGWLAEKGCSTAFPGKAAITAESFSKPLRAASGTLGESRTGLLRRATRAFELWRNVQLRSCKPDAVGADIVHVGEGCGFAGTAKLLMDLKSLRLGLNQSGQAVVIHLFE